MPPSSLIFVVIVGIWAAFFAQYWVRRREHIATARSVDAFTETMRVLQIRDPQPQTDLGARPRSYAVSPARPARPAVTVKRAEAQLTARDLDERLVGEPRMGDAATERWSSVGGAPGRGRGILAGLSSVAGGLSRAPRSVRGLTVVVGFLGTLAYAVLSLVGVLVPWAAVVPVLLTVAGVAWVRADVRAAHRAGAPVRRSASRSAAGPRAGSVADARRAGARGADVRGADVRGADDRGLSVDAVESVAPEQLIDKRDVVFDLRESGSSSAAALASGSAGTGVGGATVATGGAGRLRRPAGPLLDEDDMPLTWDPAPVPMPTYTMKAKAHRVAVPTEPSAVPVPAERPAVRRAVIDAVDADWDDDVPDVFPARRATG